MGRSFQLGRVLGIRIGASASWFVVLFVMVYGLSGYFADALDTTSSGAFAVAVAAAFGFFLSILLHELGHAVVAQREGITISGIDLWFFGGVARLDRDTETPGEEFRISAAGPAVTLLIVLAATGVAILVSSPQEVLDSARFSDARVSTAVALLSWLATINLFLLLFNLVPAFPLDGGRIARALAWRLTGDRHRGTRIAGRLGQAFSVVLIGFGIFVALEGDTFNGLWFGLLGVFLGQGARDAVVSSRWAEAIDGVTVADVMDPEPLALPGDTPLEDARARLRHQGWPWSAVVEHDGRLVGILRAAEEADGATPPAPAVAPSTAADAVGADSGEYAIAPATPLERLLGFGPLARLGALLVVDDAGRLVGVVTIDQVQRALAAAAPGP